MSEKLKALSDATVYLKETAKPETHTCTYTPKHILHTKVGEDVVVVRQVLEPPALDPREVLVDEAAVHLFLLLV